MERVNTELLLETISSIGRSNYPIADRIRLIEGLLQLGKLNCALGPIATAPEPQQGEK